MPSIRITRFAGLLPEVSGKLLREDHAQIAHNTLLWNGYLRAMPVWVSQGSAGGPITSLYPVPGVAFQFTSETQLSQAQVNWQEPYKAGALYGISAGGFRYKDPASSGTLNLIPPNPIVTTITQVVTHQNQSVYPISRTYAVTYMSGNKESAPSVFPQVGGDGTLFEGDFVTLGWTMTNALGANITGARLYRTIPGFDTSEQIGNPRETVFHLVHEFETFPATFSYVDTQSADQILGDRLMTEQFGPYLVPFTTFLGQTESGWLIAAGYQTNSGANFSTIQVSERFLWHAWPLQNLSSIPDQITDGAVFYDDFFFGTPMRPYHGRITFSDNVDTDTLDITIRPFPDTYGCVPNTMVATNFGAMYASPDGLISLQVNEDNVATKKLTNPGDNFHNPAHDITIVSARAAGWWNGFYLGFATTGVGYLYNNENNSNNQFPLGQLITFSTPVGTPGPNIVVGTAGLGAVGGEHGGFFQTWGNTLYYWPLPGYGYDSAARLEYTWRSKVFVMQGQTCFAAAKVVNEDDGPITVNFYGDGVLIYSYVVTNSAPFRFPSQNSCVEWEIELTGTGTVQEVHLATSMRELTETTGTDYG